MTTVSLAWRNVLRNRRRTALTLGAIAVATTATLLLGGYLVATVQALETDTVRQVGHLQIVQRDALDFARGQPGRYAIEQPAQLLARLRADPTVAPFVGVATPMLQLGGVIGRFESGVSSNFVGQGWDPEARLRLLEWDGHGLRLPPGASALRSDRPDGGVIGAGLAQLLGLCEALEVRHCKTPPDTRPVAAAAQAGSGSGWSDELARLGEQAAAGAQPAAPTSADPLVELLASGVGGAPNVVRMEVLSAQRIGQREADAMFVSLPLPLAQRLQFGPGRDAASALVIQLPHTGQLPAARTALSNWLGVHRPDLEVVDLEQVQPQFRQVAQMFTTLFRFVALLMVVVTLFSVSNTLNMAVGERTHEIGTLRAIGWLRRRIRSLFLIEGGLLGLLGAVLGTAMTVLLVEAVINTGRFHWTPPGRGTPVPIGVDLFSDPRLLPGVILLFTVIACVSSWWPARRAAALPVVEALRHA